MMDKIESVQTDAARYALDFLSSKAISRTGKQGIHRAPAQATVGVLFGHGSSRANDPQLHTHAVLLNVVLRQDGKTGAIDEWDMMPWQGAAASLYHMKSAWGMRKLGFEIEKKGKIFEIKGVPQEVNAHFSKRSKEVSEKAEEIQIRLGMAPDASKASRELLKIAAPESRDEKSELTRAELELLWIEEGKSLGFTQKEALALMTQAAIKELTDAELMEEANKAVWAIHQDNAVFTEPALLTMVAVQLIGLCDPDRAIRAVERLKAEVLLRTEVLVKVKDREETRTIYTTKHMVGIERAMLEFVQRVDKKHVLPENDIRAAILEAEQSEKFSFNLSEEQTLAVMAATKDNNAVTVIEGVAGAGMTTTLQVIARAYENFGYKIQDLALVWQAAKNLKTAADQGVARAIADWVTDVDKGLIELGEKTVIMLDKAGTVGALQMKQILERANENGCKVILAGDTRQPKSAAAGDPLRCIVKQIGSTRLDTIRCQKREEDRMAVKDFFSGKAADGLKPYIKRGNVSLYLNAHDTNNQLIADWMRSKAQNHGNSHLIIAAEKVIVNELNKLAHQARLEAGELGQEALELACVDAISASGAIEYTEFRVGDVVALRRNVTKQSNPRAKLQEEQKVSSRKLGEVVGISNDVLFVQLEKSDQVIAIDTEQELWKNQKGELLIQHGYALTINASQGLTRDLIFVRDSLSMSRTHAGVAMSRHREDCRLYVDKGEIWRQYLKPKFVEEYISLSEFSNQDCMDQLAKNWSRESIKTSTLDYPQWMTAEGYECNLEAQKIIELAKSRMNQLQRDIDRMTRYTEFKEIEPRPTMPFQIDLNYSIASSDKAYKDDYFYGGDAVNENPEINHYQIGKEVLGEAIKQDFMRRKEDGSVVFIAKGKNGEIVNATDIHGSKAKDCPYLPNAETWPQYLIGDDDVKTLSVVNTPLEALQLRSLQLWNNKPRTTILVAGKNADALRSEKARDFGARASSIERYDMLAKQSLAQSREQGKDLAKNREQIQQQSKQKVIGADIGAEYQQHLMRQRIAEERAVAEKMIEEEQQRHRPRY